MKYLELFLESILVIASVIYLWLWPVLLYHEVIVYKPYQLAFAILTLGVYLGDRINNLKDK